MTGTTSDSPRRALVLGGGGIAGIAWHLGVLAELQSQGIDVGAADLVVGTSAGSVAGAILRFGHVDAVYDAQATSAAPLGAADAAAAGIPPEGAEVSPGSRPHPHPPSTWPRSVSASPRSSPARPARKTPVPASAVRRSRSRRGSSRRSWRRSAPSSPRPPAGRPPPLGVCVVNAEDGEFRVIDSSDGIPLSRAVAASCSVPLVFPTVEIDGVHYIDGGARSATNADVAAGYDRVLVLSCGAEDARSPMGPQLDAAAAGLRDDADSPSAVLRGVGRRCEPPGVRRQLARRRVARSVGSRRSSSGGIRRRVRPRVLAGVSSSA